MLTEAEAARCLAEEWDRPGARLTRLDGGMGSRTWIVEDGGRRQVLKAVTPAIGEQPGAFRFDPVAGRCGIIDWSTALYGPLLYDLASAVMYLGGPDRAGGMVDAYLARGTVTRAEADDGLHRMLRFRWAVQADYFAFRIAGNDLTGISGPHENEKGLEDARRALPGDAVSG